MTNQAASHLAASHIEIVGSVKRGTFNLSLNIQIKDQHTAVLGPNGSGKTTLLRLIAGLERLDEGTLKIGGEIVDEVVANTRTTFIAPHQRKMAVVFQDQRLFEHLRVVDNVAYPMRRAGQTSKKAREQALQHLDAVGLGKYATTKPAKLSGGQRQRTAIARALATPAKVLLLDEPLSSVDDQSRDDVRQLMLNSVHDCVVWVTHYPGDAKFVDAVINLPLEHAAAAERSSSPKESTPPRRALRTT